MSKFQFIEEGRLSKTEMNSINGGSNDAGNTYYCSTTNINKEAYHMIANCAYNYHYCDNAFAVIAPDGTTISACSGSGEKFHREPSKG